MTKNNITANKLSLLIREKLHTAVLDNNKKEPLIGIFLGNVLLTTVFMKGEKLTITDCKKTSVRLEDFLLPQNTTQTNNLKK